MDVDDETEDDEEKEEGEKYAVVVVDGENADTAP